MRVAVITTIWFPASHADVIATRLIRGYPWQGEHVTSPLEVVSVYLEQVRDDDMGLDLLAEYGIPRYPTVGEALMCGGSELAVDGVVLIGEHGDYELNEYGQKLYPRRRLFDAAVAAMAGAGKFVPIFNDKHLSWAFSDAREMVDTANRLDFPLLAGSTIPLAWREPVAADWPFGARMDQAVLIGHGPTEIYGFHCLEGLQVFAERRAGGETGVVSVTGLTGEHARTACADGRVDADLFNKALDTYQLSPEDRAKAIATIRDVFLVEYADGLKGAVVICDEVIWNFGFAARGPQTEFACGIRLQGYPHGHFIFLVRHIETLITERRSPYPIERTLLTTGILDAAMQSITADGVPRDTPELTISYNAVDQLPNTGHWDPLPPDEIDPRKV